MLGDIRMNVLLRQGWLFERKGDGKPLPRFRQWSRFESSLRGIGIRLNEKYPEVVEALSDKNNQTYYIADERFLV